MNDELRVTPSIFQISEATTGREAMNASIKRHINNSIQYITYGSRQKFVLLSSSLQLRQMKAPLLLWLPFSTITNRSQLFKGGITEEVCVSATNIYRHYTCVNSGRWPPFYDHIIKKRSAACLCIFKCTLINVVTLTVFTAELPSHTVFIHLTNSQIPFAPFSSSLNCHLVLLRVTWVLDPILAAMAWMFTLTLMTRGKPE